MSSLIPMPELIIACYSYGTATCVVAETTGLGRVAFMQVGLVLRRECSQ